METTKSNSVDTKNLNPNYPLTMKLSDKGIQLSSEKTITPPHQLWNSETLRYSTTAGEYGRYLPLMKTEASIIKKTEAETTTSDINNTCDVYSAGNATKTEASSIVIPGWRRFTRLQTQIGMYRSSSFNWLFLCGDTHVISPLLFLSFVTWMDFIQQTSQTQTTFCSLNPTRVLSPP